MGKIVSDHVMLYHELLNWEYFAKLSLAPASYIMVKPLNLASCSDTTMMLMMLTMMVRMFCSSLRTLPHSHTMLSLC